MAYRRRRNSVSLAIQAMELGFAVPQVIALRLMRIAGAGANPSARDRREFRLMGTEKIAASVESWNAMLWELLRANLNLAFTLSPLWWFGSPFAARSVRAMQRHFSGAAMAALAKGVAPIRRRAVANARRLRRPA